MHPIKFKGVQKDGIPPEHTCQVQHYIKQADRSYGLYSILEPVSWEFYHVQMKRDEEVLAKMVEAGEVFWNLRLEEKLPPALDPGDSRCRGCKFRWTCQGERLFDAVPELAPGELEELNDPELSSLLVEREGLDAVLSEAKKLKDANSALIRELLGSPRKVRSASGRAVYWLNYERVTIDSKAIKSKYPDIYNANSKRSVVNQLRIY
jgi:predicted phage-related endonuclease